MKKLLSLTLASLFAISMLAGCTQNPSGDSKNDSSSSSSSSSEEAGNKMTFVNGEKELPTEFDNFVVLDYTLVDQFISLDTAPQYGQTAQPQETRYYGDWVRTFEGFDLDSIKYVSARSENFMEELLSYKPDFIVITERGARELDKYEKIAPTYVFPDTRDWKEQLKTVGEFVGKADEATEMLATYDKLVEDSRALVADEIQGKTALVLQLNEKGFKIRMPETQTSVYADLGFGVPEGLNDSFASTGVSNEDGSFPVETLVQFNPDYILVDLQSADSYNALVGTPIWEGIQAVKDGRIYETNQAGWNHINGYSSNTRRINDLVYFITEDKQVMLEYAILD